jgi:hypothetical protein
MTNLTVGDTVRVRDTYSNRCAASLKPYVGAHLRVAKVYQATGWVELEGVNPRRSGGWMPSRFELVEQPTADEIKVGKYIISLERDGELLPATKPKQYVSDAQALKVAESMAAKHGGKFIVFRAVGEFEMPTLKPTFRAL